MKELRESSDQQFEYIHQKLDRQEGMTKENGDSLKRQGEKLDQHTELLRQILAKLA